MERGSDKHGPREDEQRKEELEGLIQADRPTRAEEWREPEPPAADDPDVPPFGEEERSEDWEST